MIVTRISIQLRNEQTIHFSLGIGGTIERDNARYMTVRWDEDRWTEIPWSSIDRIDYVRFDSEGEYPEELPFDLQLKLEAEKRPKPVGYAESA